MLPLDLPRQTRGGPVTREDLWRRRLEEEVEVDLLSGNCYWRRATVEGELRTDMGGEQEEEEEVGHRLARGWLKRWL